MVIKIGHNDSLGPCTENLGFSAIKNQNVTQRSLGGQWTLQGENLRHAPILDRDILHLDVEFMRQENKSIIT